MFNELNEKVEGDYLISRIVYFWCVLQIVTCGLVRVLGKTQPKKARSADSNIVFTQIFNVFDISHG